MATKTKKKVAQEELPIELPRSAGEVHDANGRLVGKFIYLEKGDQALLDMFCNSWIDTYLQDNRFFLTVDLETTGLDFASKNSAILLYAISWDGHNAIAFSPRDFDLTRLNEALGLVPISNQNIKFDAKWIWCKQGVEINVFFDTMVACQMAYAGLAGTPSFPGFGGKFSLDNIVANILPGFKMDKSTRASFIGMSPDAVFNREQVEYAVRDALFTHRLVYPLMKRLYNQELLDLWNEIEKPLIQVLIKTEATGVKIDRPKLYSKYLQKQKDLEKLLGEVNAEVAKIPKEKLEKLVLGKDGFNPGSVQQLVKVLGAAGIHVPNTAKATLESIQATNPNPLLEKIMDWRELRDQISKQMKGWLEEDIDPLTHVIRPTFYTYGAETGRLSCREPNMQQVTEDLRPMVIARPGKVILQMDYSQFEFRACGALTNEPYLIQAYKDRADLLPIIRPIAVGYGYDDPDAFVKAHSKNKVKIDDVGHLKVVHYFAMTDIHLRNASLILGKEIDKITPDERNIGKCVALDSYVHTDKGFCTVRSLLPKRLKADTFYPLKGVKILTDTGYKDSPQIYYNGKAKAVKITTATGRELICAPHHRFRSIRKNQYSWVQAKSLKVGDELFVKTTTIFKPGKGEVKGLAAEEAELTTLMYTRAVPDEKHKFVFKTDIDEVQRLCSVLIKAGRMNPKDVKILGNQVKTVTVKESEHVQYHEDIVQWLDNLAINGSEDQIKGALRGLFVRDDNRGWHIKSLDKRLLRWAQQACSRLGAHGRIVGNVLMFWSNDEIAVTDLVHGAPLLANKKTVQAWRAYAPDNIQATIYDKMMFDNSIRNSDAAWCEKNLDKADYEFLKFCVDNDLRKDKVVSITNVGEIEMADVSVPENSTVVYEGLVSHNTLGYTFLYGGGPPRIQQALAKEKHYYDLEQCKAFVDTFFSKLQNVKAFIDESHKSVLKPGYVQTVMGRKRFFDLGPRYRAKEWEQNKQSGFREATNFLFQGANADATKKAMVEIDATFRAMYPEELRPLLLLTIHDEVVYEVDLSIIDEVSEIAEKIMVECGMIATGYKVPIECSKGIGAYWSK